MTYLQAFGYKDKELDSITEIVKDQIEQGRNVIVNVNNHYEGCAVMTIERLRAMVVLKDLFVH